MKRFALLSRPAFSFCRAIGAAGFVSALLLAGSARAATYTWDSDGNAANGITGGSGNWSSSNWTDGITDYAWAPTSALSGISFVSGTNVINLTNASSVVRVGDVIAGYGLGTGVYVTAVTDSTVTLSSSTQAVSDAGSYTTTNNVVFGDTGAGGTVTITDPVSAGTLAFTSTGYTLTGGTLSLTGYGNMNNTSTSAFLTVNSGVSATIESQILRTGNGAINVVGTLNLSGGLKMVSASKTLHIKGGGTVNLTSGTYSLSGGSTNIMVNVLQTGDAVVNMGSFQIGYSGGVGNYTVDSDNASVTLTGGINLGRIGGTSSFNLKAGTVTVGGIVGVSYLGGANASLNITGGTMLIQDTGGLSVGRSGTSSSSVGTVNISGGTLTTPNIAFGNDSALNFSASSKGIFNMTGGSVYVGSGGIYVASYHPGIMAINLSGGTMGATADWSSTMDMALSTTNGNINFKAGDSDGVAHNITLGGVLSGTGGLNKTGDGILTLNGTNSYTGETSVTAGELDVNGSIAAASAVTVNNASLGGNGKIYGSVSGTSATIKGSLTMGDTKLYGNSTWSGTSAANTLSVENGTTAVTGRANATGLVQVKVGAIMNNNGTVSGTGVEVGGLLSGTGSIIGNLTIKDNGELAPGNSAGTTTVEGNLTIENLGKVSMELDSLSSFDKVVVNNGTVLLAGTLTLTLSDAFLSEVAALTAGQTLTLIDNDGTDTISSAFSSLMYVTSSGTNTATGSSFTIGDATYDISYTGGSNGNDVIMSISVVPEPGTWAMIAGGLGMLIGARKMRRRELIG